MCQPRNSTAAQTWLRLSQHSARGNSGTCFGDSGGPVQTVGVCIMGKVLGAEIFTKLWQSRPGETLRILLPGAADEKNLLASVLARVPWETARSAVGQPSLADNNLLLRVEHEREAGAPPPSRSTLHQAKPWAC